MKTQVNKEHYVSKSYDDFFRFISYQTQIECILNKNPKKILEVGIGNGTLANYLKNNSYSVTTCDIDKELNPDKIGDIKKLPFKNNSFDTVVCFEVLEHLKWKDFERSIKELNRVSSKWIIISIPYSCLSFSFWTKFPLSNFIKKPFVSTCIRIPKFYVKHKFDGEHYWEAGKKGYSLYKIQKKVKKIVNIENEFYNPLNPYHEFFILKKN